MAKYLISQGVDRERRIQVGFSFGFSAADMATKPEMKDLMENHDKRVCKIVCDDLCEKYNTHVFNDLHIDDYLGHVSWQTVRKDRGF